jgi:hypothetical protein
MKRKTTESKTIKKLKTELTLKEVPLDVIIIIISYMTIKEFFVFMHCFINIKYKYIPSIRKRLGNPVSLQWKSGCNMNQMIEYQSSQILNIYRTKIDDLKKRTQLRLNELGFPYYYIYQKRIDKMFYHNNNPTKSYPLYCSLCIDSFQKYGRSKIDRNICLKCETFNNTGKIPSHSKGYYIGKNKK